MKALLFALHKILSKKVLVTQQLGGFKDNNKINVMFLV